MNTIMDIDPFMSHLVICIQQKYYKYRIVKVRKLFQMKLGLMLNHMVGLFLRFLCINCFDKNSCQELLLLKYDIILNCNEK